MHVEVQMISIKTEKSHKQNFVLFFQESRPIL